MDVQTRLVANYLSTALGTGVDEVKPEFITREEFLAQQLGDIDRQKNVYRKYTSQIIEGVRNLQKIERGFISVDDKYLLERFFDQYNIFSKPKYIYTLSEFMEIYSDAEEKGVQVDLLRWIFNYCDGHILQHNYPEIILEDLYRIAYVA